MFIVDELKGNTGQIGYILAVYTLSALITRLVAGYAVDSYGRKWIYLISFLFFSFLLGLYIVAASMAWLMILRFVHGFSWGASTTAASTVVVDLVPPQRRGEAIGIYGLSFTIAMAVGPLIALGILAQEGYKIMFLTAMFLSLLGFGMVLMVRFPAFEKPTIPKKFNFRNIIAPTTLPMALIQLLFGIAYGGILSFITLYAREKDLGGPGVFFLVFAAGIAFSRILSGKVFDLHGPKTIMRAGLLSGVVGLALLGFDESLMGFLFAGILIGVCMGVSMPTLQTMANNVVDSRMRGAANATFITAFDIGIGAGSLLLGFIAQWTSLACMYLLSALIVFAALAIYTFFVQQFYERKRLNSQ